MSQRKESLLPIEGIDYIRRDPELGKLVIDMSRLDEPARVFWAQAVRVTAEDSPAGAVYMSFAQIAPPRRVIALVVVALEGAAFHDLMETVNDSFRHSVNRSVERAGAARCELTAEEADSVPVERIGMFKAVIGRVSVAVTGAQVDWYDLSARSIVAIAHSLGTGGGVVPLVTISMSPAVLKTLIEQADVVNSSRQSQTPP